MIDPSYAPAAALIGSCRMHQRVHGLGKVSDTELAEAVRLARRAIEAGKDDPDSLWMAAYTLTFFTGEHATGANVVDRALTLNPNSAHAWMVRGFVSIAQNRSDRAIEALERAMQLSPRDPWGGRAFTLGLAFAHLNAGRYEQAVEWADRSLAAQPDYRPAMRIKVISYAYLDRIDEARDWLGRLLELDPALTISRIKASTPYLSAGVPGRPAQGRAA